MRRQIAIVVFLVTSFTAVSRGQQPASSDAPATREQILKFMDIMHVKAGMIQMFDGMKAQARLGAVQAFKQKVPNATPAQIEKVEGIADEMFSGFPVDEMLEAIVPIYQKHLSQADLNAVIAFYSSPVGQKFVKEAPAMMSEGMQVGGEIGRRQMAEVNQRIEKRIEDLVKEAGPEKTETQAKTPH